MPFGGYFEARQTLHKSRFARSMCSFPSVRVRFPPTAVAKCERETLWGPAGRPNTLELHTRLVKYCNFWSGWASFIENYRQIRALDFLDFLKFSMSYKRLAKKHYFHALAEAMAYLAERQKLPFRSSWLTFEGNPRRISPIILKRILIKFHNFLEPAPFSRNTRFARTGISWWGCPSPPWALTKRYAHRLFGVLGGLFSIT